ncbi:MAG: hypothetical protein QOF56_2906 [Acidobacteriaceae bacterium]|nr:hypothetical protein [Acidobacteriaceae bacterium]
MSRLRWNTSKLATASAPRHQSENPQSWVFTSFCFSLYLCGEKKLFEDAVVKLLAFPVGGGLDEG